MKMFLVCQSLYKIHLIKCTQKSEFYIYFKKEAEKFKSQTEIKEMDMIQTEKKRRQNTIFHGQEEKDKHMTYIYSYVFKMRKQRVWSNSKYTILH